MNISIKIDDITNFDGDVIVIPCDSELTYKKSGLVQKILEKAGPKLVKELTAIGYCEIGYAVITQGYELKANHLIFMPISDHNNLETKMSFVDLHQSLRAVFNLADLYRTKTLAMAEIQIPNQKVSLLESVTQKLQGDNHPKLSNEEIDEIIISTAKSFDTTAIKELTVYKYRQ